MAKDDRMDELNREEHNLMVKGLNYYRKAREEEDMPSEDIEYPRLIEIDASARP